MLTAKSNQAAKLRLVSEYGDLAMFLQFFHSKLWRAFYTGEKKPFWNIFIWIIGAKVEMFALASRALFRVNFGSNSTGFLMSIWTIALFITFNAEHIVGLLISFLPFIAPLLLIFISTEEFTNYTFYQIHSIPFLVWLFLFTLMQTVHVYFVYKGKKPEEDKAKRGHSLISNILPNKIKISEFTIQAFLEPAITILIGWVMLVSLDDKIFFVFAVISGLCLSTQELLDSAYRAYHSRH